MLKTLFPFVALLVSGGSTSAPVGEGGTVTAARTAAGVVVELRGRDGWRLNADYPVRLTVDGVVHGPSEAKWRGRSGGKAAAASWTVVTSATRGTVKAAFCDASRCLPPSAVTIPLP